ncbi:MAG: hypothetical protein V2A76_03975, partial [Planctomycetota bacterium]
NGWRNRNRGHGGAVGDAVLREQSELLEGRVKEYQAAVMGSWDSWPLIHAGESRYSNGIHHCSAKRVTGPRAPFQSVEVRLQDPAEYDQLHLYDQGSESALPLLPFVRMMASPSTAQNACYFFNRVEGEQVRYVSYHFSPEPNVVRTESAVQKALSDLATGERS